MSRSTISYESLAESMGSFVASAIVPDHASNVDSESEPMEAPASPVVSDSDSFEPSLNSESFSRSDTPVGSAASDPDDEPLGSPDTAEYFGGFEFSKDDPSEDGSIDALSGPPPKGCRVSPAHALHSMPTKLLSPRKRFIASKRVEALEREVDSLTARLVAAMIQIDALSRDDIDRDVREAGIKARLKRVEDAIQER
ncbi:hypothetical protein Tco_1002089 [Tanacetum coccineum]|uniref:Uncharacterized protein n=1 Tax=Tanacetum coccineum TaxID=301880 RepID=A0ABQ5F5E6_9ASTR